MVAAGAAGDVARCAARARRTRTARLWRRFSCLLLPIYLVELGFSPMAIGAIVTSTLIGTALLTLWVGWIANRHSRRPLLLAAALLMAGTGAAFALIMSFWPLLLVALVGTMNPTSAQHRLLSLVEKENRGVVPD
jgi:hypothetical protein